MSEKQVHAFHNIFNPCQYVNLRPYSLLRHKTTHLDRLVEVRESQLAIEVLQLCV